MINLTPSDIVLYYFTWLLPSSTFSYIILHDRFKWKKLNAYIASSLIAGTVMLPIEFFVFS